MKEIWKDIKDYEGVYQISNFIIKGKLFISCRNYVISRHIIINVWKKM